MPCFSPLVAHRNCATGEVRVLGKGSQGDLMLPCGQCVGCRLERSRQWAVRLMHEASMHEDNCFLTLTYDDEHLPSDLSLRKSDFQDFFKRLRKFESHRDDFENLWHRPIRFFHCGEYGELRKRPHYHACVFGYDFYDKVFHSERNGIKLYESPLLAELWGLGFCTVGTLTFESAAYVARYVMKKVTGVAAEQHYTRVNEYGEVFCIEPEYVTMSRRPGIGHGWFQKFGSEVFPSDEVISRGFPSRPPRYYDSLCEAAEPDVFKTVKVNRLLGIAEHAEDLSAPRLRAREVCTKARVSLLRRGLD